MKLHELEHVLRACREITQERSFVLVGSQAVLLLLDHPSDLLLRSAEIDLYPANAPEKADLIDGAIGALSPFHDTHGYHADGVDERTATLPPDWMARATLKYFGELTAITPCLPDLAASKIAAGREKDAEFVTELLRSGHLPPQDLLAAVSRLQVGDEEMQRLLAFARRRIAESTP